MLPFFILRRGGEMYINKPLFLTFPAVFPVVTFAANLLRPLGLVK